ncbi:MAG: TDP-N-acetylfucosamine:lipid II N-acetylfucosaminyltransferase [Petrimonas sp.]|nr:TDP-N-acetylfucosamine:lipid II N-acetylfucosaminyltransferase [Petrimonas sp.]
MNYHLMIDEKFTNDFIADAEKYAPHKNVYIVSCYTKEPRFVNSALVTLVKSAKKYWFSTIANKLKKSDKVFIHWLDRRVYDIVLSLPEEVEVGIFSWMGDLIATPTYLFDKDILKSTSFDFFNKHKKNRFDKDPQHGRFYNSLLFGRHIWRVAFSPVEWRKKKQVMQRINLFFHWNEFDYQWVQDHYPGFRAKFVYFVYEIGLNENNSYLLNSDSWRTTDQITIWLGNSATISNNHFEALDDISHLKDDPVEIICPLSYGERTGSKYTKQVIEKGERIFGKKFKPLLEFIDREEYYAMFNKVGIVVMNHIRSQAAGNVFMFLKLGKIIFMDEKSTLYQFIHSKNAQNIYTMRQLKNFSFNELKKMLDEKQMHKDIGSILDMDAKVANLKKYLN